MITPCDDAVNGGSPNTLTSAKLDVLYDNTNTPNGVVTGFGNHGYINPKYVIWGVTYAPPGPTSFVDYTNSSSESSTNSVNSSFSSTFATSLRRA